MRVFNKYIYPLAFLSIIICMGYSFTSAKENKIYDYPKEIIFEEDFESPVDYQNRWQAPSGWSLVEGQIYGRKTTVLDIKGGNEGLSVQGGFADFDYEADVRVVDQGGGFLFRAQDADNLYMLQLVSDNKPWNRDKLPVLNDSYYPHTKKNGE